MKTHPLNVAYLVVGLAYLGVAGSWALRQTGVIDFGEIHWLLPLTLVAAGVVGLVALAGRALRGRDGSRGTSGPQDPGYPDPGSPGHYDPSQYHTGHYDERGDLR